MSSARLKARIPAAEFITTAQLIRHELKYHKVSQVDGSGKCDIYFTDDAEHCVHGVVYDIDEAGKQVLDVIEGVGKGYEEKTVAVAVDGQSNLEAVTYYATSIDSTIKPYHWYKEHVLRGAREFNLPPAYIERYLDVVSIDDNTERQQMELAIYQFTSD